MTQLSAETYIPGFRDREQHHAYDDTRRSRFDGFGCLIDNPTIEGFDESDFHATMARQRAQMLARQRCEAAEAQARAQKLGNSATARIRANREHVVQRKLA